MSTEATKQMQNLHNGIIINKNNTVRKNFQLIGSFDVNKLEIVWNFHFFAKIFLSNDLGYKENFISFSTFFFPRFHNKYSKNIILVSIINPNKTVLLPHDTNLYPKLFLFHMHYVQN